MQWWCGQLVKLTCVNLKAHDTSGRLLRFSIVEISGPVDVQLQHTRSVEMVVLSCLRHGAVSELHARCAYCSFCRLWMHN